MYLCCQIIRHNMLKRKIEDTLTKWKNKTGHKPLVIMGIRQCGKTFITQHFAAENYKSVVYMNFIKEPERINAFVGSKARFFSIFPPRFKASSLFRERPASSLMKSKNVRKPERRSSSSRKMGVLT